MVYINLSFLHSNYMEGKIPKMCDQMCWYSILLNKSPPHMYQHLTSSKQNFQWQVISWKTFHLFPQAWGLDGLDGFYSLVLLLTSARKRRSTCWVIWKKASRASLEENMFGSGGEEKMLPWYLNQSQHWIKLYHAEENAHFVLTNSARFFFFSSALSLSGNSSWSLLDPFFHFRPVSDTGNHTSYVQK